MSWWRRIFGGGDESSAREPSDPAEVTSEDPWSGRLSGLSAESFAKLAADLEHEPDAMKLEVLRRVRELLPQHTPAKLALARLGGSEARALWVELRGHAVHAPEATAWLIDAALTDNDREQAARLAQEALVLNPLDDALLERALSLSDALPALPPPALPTAWSNAPILAPAPERVPPGYSLLRRLGAGGFGVVYEARDEHLDRTVALKFLHAHLGDNRSAVQAFLEEARCMATLDLEGVVEVLDVFEHAQAMALEFCSDGSLQDRLNVVGPMPQLAYGLLLKPALTLAAAHEKGVMHGDLKPDNLLFRGADMVLTDFGAGAEAAGTDGYRAPEQGAGIALTPAMDVFALGRILRALTGDDDALAARCTDEDPRARPTMAELAQALNAQP